MGVLTHKTVKHWVSHAVETGQEEGEVVGVEDSLGKLAIIFPQASYNQQDVIRQKADEENNHGTQY